MTAVASPPSFPNINRPGWGINGGQSLNAMNSDESRGMFPRKTMQRTNSSSSISSTSTTASGSTLVSTNGSANGGPVSAAGDLNGWPSAGPRKRPPPKSQWPATKVDRDPEFTRMSTGRQQITGPPNGASPLHQQSAFMPPQGQVSVQQGNRTMAEPMAGPAPGSTPVLYLLSLNGTFERKTISVPFHPDTLRIGRQTNAKSMPTPTNGFFDSKVLSRQHAEIYADRTGKIMIKDIKSSNGTFVNGTRLSQENRESEPHEIVTNDHLELGIDIVSEDQKSVVHHKVAAKVEHAGFLSAASSLLDMSFGDLDPANGGMMVPQMGGMQLRGRTGSQSSMGSNRMAVSSNMNAQVNGPGIALQRGLFSTQPSTEAIVKKLHQETRNARLQAQDLARTHHFISALLSKDDIKNEPKSEAAADPAKAHMVNGNVLPLRADNKARFSDPPAPPPQQPLPEKPDVTKTHASDVPSLKRGTTERPKSHPSNGSPIRPDNLQILQLTEALQMARKELDAQQTQMQVLEDSLNKEREARKHAEELARRLEEASAETATRENAARIAAIAGQGSILEQTFDPPADTAPFTESNARATDATKAVPQQVENVQASASLFQSRIDMMAAEIKGLKQQLQDYKQRAEKAEVERDADRITLAEMVNEIRTRDEEDARRAAQSQSKSRRGLPAGSLGEEADLGLDGAGDDHAGKSIDDPSQGQPTLSRANTITPSRGDLTRLSSDSPAIQTIPYASMMGVVLFGMGLMAYLNGWQTQPSLER